VIRLMVAEGAHLVRGALVALLELEPDLVVVAEVGTPDEVVPAALKWRPDLVIMDLDLARTGSLPVTADLRSNVPECRVLILAGPKHPTVLRRAMTRNVDGLLMKDASPKELADAVRKAVAGEQVIDPQFALTVWNGDDELLTPREVDVLRLTADGEDVPMIAESLHLSVGTVRNYLTTIVSKLSARNRIDAIRIARASGIL